MISRLVSFVVKETFGKISTSVSSVTVSYLIRYDKLLRNATAVLLQNETEVYYKLRQFYYKMQKLLQIATTLLQNANTFSFLRRSLTSRL